MNAFEIPNLRFSLPSAGTIPRYRFVTVDSNGNAALPSAGGAVVGVTYNATTVGQACEIGDGIVMVELGGTVAAGALVQTDNTGKAVTRTAGIALGTAVTGGTVGQLAAVKAPAVSGTDGAASDLQTVTYHVENLAADGDLAAVPFYVVPDGYNATVLSAQIISQGSPAGIDDDNTCVIAVKTGTTTIATKTYNTGTAFPASGAVGALVVDAENDVVGDNDTITLTVTNGATADPPAFVLQVVVSLAKE